jgi:uncharacterized protein (DUF58 family)
MTAAETRASELLDRSADLAYKLAWRSRSVRAGAHRSVHRGAGGLFRDLASLLEHPDPRRIDIRQSLRDPFETIHVRRFEQNSAIAVTMLLDVSASMSFSGRTRKMRLAADLAAVFAASARRTGDTFSLIACDDRVRDELFVPATRSRAGEAEMISRLWAFVPKVGGASALTSGAQLIGPRRGLVFVVSDFLLAESELTSVFEALSMHDVIPIVLVDSSEIDALPSWGLVALTDLETGRRCLVAMRPSVKAAWQRRSEERRSFFRRLAQRYRREPFEIVDRIDWDGLSAALLRGA